MIGRVERCMQFERKNAGREIDDSKYVLLELNITVIQCIKKLLIITIVMHLCFRNSTQLY